MLGPERRLAPWLSTAAGLLSAAGAEAAERADGGRLEEIMLAICGGSENFNPSTSVLT